MRQVFTIIPLALLILQSCALTYRQVRFEKTYEDNILTTKEKKLKQNGSNCQTKEITTKKDTLNNQITNKELVIRNCRGAYSYVVKRKTWTLVNGEMVVTVSSN